MKRKHARQYPRITSIKHRFHWHECAVCGFDFRNVRGWHRIGQEIYICLDCAPNIAEAATKYSGFEHLEMNPPTSINILNQGLEDATDKFLLDPMYITAALAPETPEWFKHIPAPKQPLPSAASIILTDWWRADAEARYFQWWAYFAKRLLAERDRQKG